MIACNGIQWQVSGRISPGKSRPEANLSRIISNLVEIYSRAGSRVNSRRQLLGIWCARSPSINSLGLISLELGAEGYDWILKGEPAAA